MKSFIHLCGPLLLAACLYLPSCGAAPSGSVHPGAKAPRFTLTDTDGNDRSLDGALKGKAAVLIFMATRCPVSNAYNDRMTELAREYTPHDVSFIGINSNIESTAEEVARHAREHTFSFPVCKDAHAIVADEYGAQVTPEVFLIDHNGVVRYHGRIDDNAHPERVKLHDLANAIDALLAGRDLPVTDTKAFGCGIGRERSVAR